MGSLPSLNGPGERSVMLRWFALATTGTATSGLRQKSYIKLEQEIIQTAERGRESIEHCVSDKALRAAVAAKPTLTAEQVEAVCTYHPKRGQRPVRARLGRDGQDLHCSMRRGLPWRQTATRSWAVRLAARPPRNSRRERTLKASPSPN